ncbi:hypothetical protein NKG94_25235 [Micromonospora sp. M12]
MTGAPTIDGGLSRSRSPRRSGGVSGRGARGRGARPLAHGDDDGGGDREAGMLVVTYRPGTGPPPATRRVDGVLVDLTVAAADDYLAQARVLSPLWPLTADRYVTTQALHDPTGWLRTLRDEHLGRLARARPAEFSTAARQAWYRAARRIPGPPGSPSGTRPTRPC